MAAFNPVSAHPVLVPGIETDQPVVPWVFLFSLFKVGGYIWSLEWKLVNASVLDLSAATDNVVSVIKFVSLFDIGLIFGALFKDVVARKHRKKE